MKKLILSISALAGICLLSACATGAQNSVALFKPNTPPAAKQADLDKCKIASFKAIPQAITTQYVGGYYSPGSMECSFSHHGGYTYCNQFGGFYDPPYAYTEDVNAPIRWRYVSACLQKKGYYIIYNVPRCANNADFVRSLSARSPAGLVCNTDTNLDY